MDACELLFWWHCTRSVSVLTTYSHTAGTVCMFSLFLNGATCGMRQVQQQYSIASYIAWCQTSVLLSSGIAHHPRLRNAGCRWDLTTAEFRRTPPLAILLLISSSDGFVFVFMAASSKLQPSKHLMCTLSNTCVVLTRLTPCTLHG